MDAVTTYGWTRDNTTNVTGFETGTGDITGSLNNVSGVHETVIFAMHAHKFRGGVRREHVHGHGNSTLRAGRSSHPGEPDGMLR